MKEQSLAKKYLTILLVILSVTFVSAGLLERSFRAGESDMSAVGSRPAVSHEQGIVLDSPLNTLDPLEVSSTAERLVAWYIYETLLVRDPVRGEPVPGPLCASWEAVTGGYDLVLAETLFHTGEPVTAEDVKFSLERLVRQGGRQALGLSTLEGFEAFRSGAAETLGGIVVTGPSSLSFRLNGGEEAFLKALSRISAAVLPRNLVGIQPRYGRSLADTEELSVAGTGQARLAAWGDHFLVLEASPDRDSRFPRRVQIGYGRDMAWALQELETLRVEEAVLSRDPRPLLKVSGSTLGTDLDELDTGMTHSLWFSGTMEPFFRNGLIQGLDRQDLARDLGVPALRDDVPGYGEDESLARTLLAAFPDRGVRLAHTATEDGRLLAQRLMARWEELGVVVEVVELEGEQAVRQALRDGRADAALILRDRTEGAHGLWVYAPEELVFAGPAELQDWLSANSRLLDLVDVRHWRIYTTGQEGHFDQEFWKPVS